MLFGFGFGLGLGLGFLVLKPFRGFDIPIIGAHIGAGTGMIDHVWIHGYVKSFKEVGKADTINGFTDALVFQGILCKEIDTLFGELIQPFVIFVGLRRSPPWPS